MQQKINSTVTYNIILHEPSSINENFWPGNLEEVQMIRKQRENHPKWQKNSGGGDWRRGILAPSNQI